MKATGIKLNAKHHLMAVAQEDACVEVFKLSGMCTCPGAFGFKRRVGLNLGSRTSRKATPAASGLRNVHI